MLFIISGILSRDIIKCGIIIHDIIIYDIISDIIMYDIISNIIIYDISDIIIYIISNVIICGSLVCGLIGVLVLSMKLHTLNQGKREK